MPRRQEVEQHEFFDLFPLRIITMRLLLQFSNRRGCWYMRTQGLSPRGRSWERGLRSSRRRPLGPHPQALQPLFPDGAPPCPRLHHPSPPPSSHSQPLLPDPATCSLIPPPPHLLFPLHHSLPRPATCSLIRSTPSPLP